MQAIGTTDVYYALVHANRILITYILKMAHILYRSVEQILPVNKMHEGHNRSIEH